MLKQLTLAVCSISCGLAAAVLSTDWAAQYSAAQVTSSAGATAEIPAREAFPASTPDEFKDESAGQLVTRAIDYWRGQASYTNAMMRVHRQSWQRELQLKSWTKGRELSLVRFVAPAKDAGNATLTQSNEVWTFNPKSDRVIKIPPSMKSQSWMGSDFSYQDLAKDDEILHQYDHRFLGVESHEGKRVRVIESTPHADAPVVWGKEILKICADLLIIVHEYYDQDGALVKAISTSEIAMLGGKLFPKTFRMTLVEDPSSWTEITHLEAEFDRDYQPDFFSLTNLRNLNQ